MEEHTNDEEGLTDAQQDVWNKLVQAAHLVRGEQIIRIVDVAAFYNLDPYELIAVLDKAINHNEIRSHQKDFDDADDSELLDMLRENMGINLQSGNRMEQFMELTKSMEGEWKTIFDNLD